MTQTFTLELNDLIKEAFEHYILDEQSNEFFTHTNFKDLNAGDLVVFPFNMRNGVYKIESLTKQPVPLSHDDVECRKMLIRNHCGSYLVPDQRNSGVWLLRINPSLVSWKQWNEQEGLITMDMSQGCRLNTNKTEGYSNWYDYQDWPHMIPLALFENVPKPYYDKIKTYYPSNH